MEKKEMKLNPKTITLSSIIGLDLETNGLNPRENDILLISITTKCDTYVLDTSKYSSNWLTNLFINLSKVKVVAAHNAKFDCSFIYSNYGVLLENVHCTMLASQILENYPTRVLHNLNSVLLRYCGTQLKQSKNKEKLQKSFIGLKKGTTLSDAQLEYAAEDTYHLVRLYMNQLDKVDRLYLNSVLKLENTLLPVIVQMETDGCLIDKNAWVAEIEKWKDQLTDIKYRLDSAIKRITKAHNLTCGIPVDGKVFNVVDMFGNVLINYSSASQIIYLFKAIGEDPPIDKENKETVGEDSLMLYATEHPDSELKEFLEILLEYREYQKLISTYGDKFLIKLDKNNYIHTDYTQCRTKTGRLSSKAPNLQNIPGEGKGGKLREFFIAKPGYKLITCDMAGAEIAIAADYSGEELLLNSLKYGEDMHSKLASVSFSIIFGEDFVVSKSEDPVMVKGVEVIPNKLRKVNKSVTFAKFYKAGANRIYQVLSEYINKFHPPEDRLKIAKQISEALDKEMPQLTEYLSKKIKEATTKGILRGSKLGRIRYFDPTAYGQAANFPKLRYIVDLRVTVDKTKYFDMGLWGVNPIEHGMNSGKTKSKDMLILSQAKNAFLEGAETTGGIGTLNDQRKRPALYGTVFVR